MNAAETIERDLAQLLERANAESGVAELLALQEALERAEGRATEIAHDIVVAADSTNGLRRLVH